MVGICYWFSLFTGGFAMSVIILILNMFLAFFLAFQAGQMKTMIDVDKAEGRKPEWKLYFFLVANTIISVYFIMSIYGSGLRHAVS
jgi:riboflavin transporter FmnP